MLSHSSHTGRLTKELTVVRLVADVGEMEARLPTGALVRGVTPGHDFFDSSSLFWSFEASMDGGETWLRLRSSDEPSAAWTDD